MQLSVKFIKDKINDFKPEIGIILGSGLGDFADKHNKIGICYNEIPHFHASKVEGHKGKLVFAEVEGKKVVMMQGRYHFYEGYDLGAVTHPVKVMKKLGVKTLIITNAAGAINKNFKPGDLMILKDHINFMGTNPLIGKNDESLGVRFPDMSNVYNKDLRTLILEKTKNMNVSLKEGVYVACTGPSYETPAEIRMFGLLGADAVGMSTVPEAIVACYCGIKVVGVSCLTNYAAGVSEQPLAHSEVIETADRVKADFERLLIEIIKAV